MQLERHGPACGRLDFVYGGLAGGHRLYELLGFAHGGHHGSTGQFFFAGEVFVQTGLGNAHFGGNFIHRHRVKTFFGQQAVHRLDDGGLSGRQHLDLERFFRGFLDNGVHFGILALLIK